ncbi:hypothetical protein Scep_022195 [Stephania cephalantha]|uniref:Glycosyltransferase n=1 Tax=Stephania cephalantha TaxID=152367 RepID=A0AAP0F4X5_9MAGN
MCGVGEGGCDEDLGLNGGWEDIGGVGDVLRGGTGRGDGGTMAMEVEAVAALNKSLLTSIIRSYMLFDQQLSTCGPTNSQLPGTKCPVPYRAKIWTSGIKRNHTRGYLRDTECELQRPPHPLLPPHDPRPLPPPPTHSPLVPIPPQPPSALLSDFFLGSTLRLASDLSIPRFLFSPSAALFLSITNSLWRHLPNPSPNNNPIISFPEIPNSPSLPFSHLSTIYRNYIKSDRTPDWEFIKEGMLANMDSYGVVINSFADLDSDYLNHLKPDLGHNRVWAVGPLLPAHDDPGERGGSSSVVKDELLAWLDSCPDASVVYVCFGSQAVLTNRQMEGLARGLELSGARFVWSVKEPTKGHAEGAYGSVPGGFGERVKGRGLVIRGWAPQVVILSHRAVGAFLTHCGWNSVLESVVAGVPMLTWPMGADQFSTAWVLEKRAGVAVRVCEGAGTVPEAEGLARTVAEAVSEGVELRRMRARELSEAALGAVREGGNSYRDLDGLMEELRGLALEPSDLKGK